MREQFGKIYIYTDGSCLRNPGGPGGWCAILRYRDDSGKHEKVISGRDVSDTVTNNRMELTAAIKGLQAVKNRKVETIVVSDSKYFVRGFNEWMHKWAFNDWKRAYDDKEGEDGVLNRDLWEVLYDLNGRFRKVCATHVKGHNGNDCNERADLKARMEASGLS